MLGPAVGNVETSPDARCVGLARVPHGVRHQVQGSTEEASDDDCKDGSSSLLSMVCREPCVRTVLVHSGLNQTHELSGQIRI